MRSVADLPDDDAMANHLFGPIIRRLDAVEVSEGPESVAALEQPRTRLGFDGIPATIKAVHADVARSLSTRAQR